jgi:hypothetical protein
MSRTSDKDKRHESDYYITPVSKIKEFLTEFLMYENHAFDKTILDCCAGGDKENKMSYPEALSQIGVSKEQIKTIDIRKDSRANYICDYLNTELHFTPFTIITNPPYLLAREFAEKALNDVGEDGFVIMLLRLNFFGSKKRKSFWDNQMPKYCFVHNRRISFTKDGKTDATEYAHFVWQKNHFPQFTLLKVI